MNQSCESNTKVFGMVFPTELRVGSRRCEILFSDPDFIKNIEYRISVQNFFKKMGSSSSIAPSESLSESSQSFTDNIWEEQEQILFVKPSTELATEEKTFIYDRIKNLSFFSLLSEDSKQSIISLFRKCTNNDSPYLFKQGWKGKYFFIIAKGKVIVEQNRFVVRRLGEGDCFGELSLMYGLERTTSIRTSKDTLKNNIYYVLKGRDYLEIIKQHNQINKKFLHLFFSELKILTYLTYKDKRNLIQNIIQVRFQAGQRILTKHDDPYALFFVREGTVKVGFAEREPMILQKGQHFGFYGSRQSEISAVAGEELLCYTIGKHQLIELLGNGFTVFYVWNRLRSILLRKRFFHGFSLNKIEQLCWKFSFRKVKPYEVLCKRAKHIKKLIVPIACFKEENNQILGLEFLENYEPMYQKDCVALKTGYIAQISLQNAKKYISSSRNTEYIEEKKVTQKVEDMCFARSYVQKKLGFKTHLNKKIEQIEYLCRDSKFHIQFVLKQIHLPPNMNADELTSYQHEKQLLYSLNNHFVRSLYDTYCSLDTQELYFYYEYRHGVPLFEVLRKQGMLSTTVIKFFTASIVYIIEYLHEKNVLHRGLSLESFWIQRIGYIVLNHLVGAKKHHQKMRTKTLMGLPHYQAPEMFNGQQYGYGVDFWSAGIIIYFILFMRFPFGNQQQSPLKIYKAIEREKLYIPETKNDKQVRPLLSILLEKSSEKRNNLTWREIKKQSFFRSFKWQNLISRQMEAPYFPKIPVTEATLENDLDLTKSTIWDI